MEFHHASSKPRDSQFHAVRQLVWELAFACGSWLVAVGNRVGTRQQKMDTHFFVNACGDGHRRSCWQRDQTRGAACTAISAIRAPLGRSALQLKISFISLRPRFCLDCVFWSADFCAATNRRGLSTYSDADWILADVSGSALPLRCRLCCGSWDFMRFSCSAFSLWPNGKSAMGNRKLDAEGVRFELTRPFGLPVFKTGAINRSATPPKTDLRDANSLLHYSITPREIPPPVPMEL